MLKSEIDFVLTTPIDFTNGQGEVVEAHQLLLIAPTTAQDANRIKLKQGFTQSMFALMQNNRDDKEASPGDDANPNGEAIVMLLYASSLDLVSYKKTFRDLIVSGSGKVEGMPITSVIFDRISPDDSDRMLGEYIAAFMQLSVTNTPKPK